MHETHPTHAFSHGLIHQLSPIFFFCLNSHIFITTFSTKLHFYINCILYLFCHSTINSCINLDLKWEKTSWKWKEKTRWNASLQRKFSWQKIEYRQHQAFATKKFLPIRKPEEKLQLYSFATIKINDGRKIHKMRHRELFKAILL